ncbi:MAG TPA: NMD3-related protein [Thermoplasmata archaeon]
MFCVECGAEGATVNGLCAKCFAKKHPLVAPPPHIDIARCGQCGSFLLATGWVRTEPDTAILQLLRERVAPLPPFKRILFSQEAREEDENNFALTVKASGHYEGLSQIQGFHTRLRMKPSLCERCQKQASRYYEGILQVRGDGRALTDREIGAIRTLVRTRIDRRQGESGEFVSRTEEVDGGLDFYVSTNALGTRLAREIADSLGGTVAASPKLYGQRGGKELYRVTTLVRLPPFAIGDVVRHKDAIAEVVAVRPFVELRDLRSRETRRYKAKDLRGLRRVDAQRFEARIRQAPDGRTVAVHPESGAERPLAFRGARKATAVVVWTQEDVYLSGLPAEGSKA